MERNREDARVAGEDRRGAVALVDVEVDHDDAQPRLGLEHARGDGDIVEDAVAAAARAAAWWVPPARLAATPREGAARAAAIVAPTERRERSTICSLHGKPIARCSAVPSVPLVTALTYAASWTRVN